MYVKTEMDWTDSYYQMVRPTLAQAAKLILTELYYDQVGHDLHALMGGK